MKVRSSNSSVAVRLLDINRYLLQEPHKKAGSRQCEPAFLYLSAASRLGAADPDSSLTRYGM